ncbi:MAG: glycoside hydrolase domain-containing protein, partial [Kiritimatiellia bacterium]
MALTSILTPSTVRHYPRQPLPTEPLRKIEAALNERFSFQLALRSDSQMDVTVEATGPAGWQVRVRRVGYVPMAHHNTPIMTDPLDQEGLGEIPGFVPDPLFDEQKMLLAQDELHAFWISVQPAAKAAPGNYSIEVTATPGEGQGRPVTRKLRVKLHDVVIPPRKDFHVSHWFYNDQLIDWYKTDLFDERYWEIVRRYVQNVVDHGQNVLYV